MTPPNIFSAEFACDPYPQYRIMRDRFPLYFHAAINAYVLSRHEDVRLALTDPNFTTRSYGAQIEPLLGITVVQLEGREHARQRRLLAASFRPGRFEAEFAATVEAVADGLIDRFRHRATVELVGEFITAFTVGVLAAVIGLPRSDMHRFRSWYTALLRFGINLVGDPAVTQAGLAARDEMDAYLRPLVAAYRRGTDGPSLLSLLANAESDGQRLTDDEIVRFGMLMIFAGGETVEKTLATFLRNLVAHPDQLARVRTDRRLIGRALAESLRYTAPTHMVPRRTRSDAVVSGGVIPAESEVICFLASANRDDRRFAAPDAFDIFRADLDVDRAFTSGAAHTSFGLGRHFCIGASMAMAEIGIAANRLLDAMAEIRFSHDKPPPDQGLFLRGPQSLGLSFMPTGG